MKNIFTLILFTFLVVTTQAQMAYYVNDNATGTGSGETWEDAYTTIESALQAAIDANSKNTIVYIKEGEYTSEGTANGPGLSSTLPAGDVVIIGGFSESATGTDICRYNPGLYQVNITSGIGLYRVDKALGQGDLTIKGLRFDSRGGTVAIGSVVTVVGTTPDGTTPSTYTFEELTVTNQGAHAFFFSHNDKDIVDTFTFKNCFFSGNDSDTPIRFQANVDNALLFIDGCDFKNSESYSNNNGGAMRILGDNMKVDIRNSIFCSNMATGGIEGSLGGVLYMEPQGATVGGKLLIDNCNFIRNKAKQGGAIFLKNLAQAKIINSYFEGQEANLLDTGLGGAIAFEGRTDEANELIIENNTFYGNMADKGGAIGVYHTQLLSTGNKFHGNNAKGLAAVGGGALFIDGDDITNQGILSTITNDIYTGNNSPTTGGAIRITNNDNLRIEDTEFCGNYTDAGVNEGGALRIANSIVTLNNNTFKDNYAQEGGALIGVGSRIVTNNNIFIENHAGASGGAVKIVGLKSGYGGIDYLFNGDIFYKNYIDFSREILGLNGGGALFAIEVNNLGISENIELRNVEFIENQAIKDDNTDGHGGGLYLRDANAKIIDCKFEKNHAKEGGGMYTFNTSLFLEGTSTTQSYFINNIAYDNGGAAKIIGDDGHRYTVGYNINGVYSFDLAVQNTEFYGNTTSFDGTTNDDADGGGALHLTNVSATGIYNSSFIDNEAWVLGVGAEKGGGAIHSTNRVIHIGGSSFSGNKVNGETSYTSTVGGSDIISVVNSVFETTNMQLINGAYRDFILGSFMGYSTSGLVTTTSSLSVPSHTCSVINLKDIGCPTSELETFEEQLVTTVNCVSATSVSMQIEYLNIAKKFVQNPEGPFTYTAISPTGRKYTAENISALEHTLNIEPAERGAYTVRLTGANGCSYETIAGVNCPNLSVNTTAVLPVELVYFTATENKCNIDLNWRAETEEDFSHYEIQWSRDGRTFEVLDSIYGIGGIAGQDYTWTMTNAASENYYRLKMVDLDGTYEYSDLIYSKTDCEVEEELMVFPNPVSVHAGAIDMRFYADGETADISIVNMFGVVVESYTLPVESSNWNRLRLDISNYPIGNYVVMINKTRQIFTILE